MKFLMKLLGSVSWIITALASIHVGLLALDYNAVAVYFPAMAQQIGYVAGIAGIVSLVFFVMHLSCHMQGGKTCDCM